MTLYSPTDPIVISEGNMKVGKTPNVSLPPILSCKADVPCGKEKVCYSLKAWVAYPNVRDARRHNWSVWHTEPDRYFNDIREYLGKHKSPFFRFHSDGDIPSLDYYKQMIRLANDTPNTRFLTFTKRYELPLHTCPSNLSIIPSAWPNHPIPNFKIIAWMEDGRETRYQRPAFECNKGCEECYACWFIYDIGMDVIFKKH